MCCSRITSGGLTVGLLLHRGVLFSVTHALLEFCYTVPWPGFHQCYVDTSSLPPFHHLLSLTLQHCCHPDTECSSFALICDCEVCSCQGFLGGLCGTFKGACRLFCVYRGSYDWACAKQLYDTLCGFNHHIVYRWLNTLLTICCKVDVQNTSSINICMAVRMSRLLFIEQLLNKCIHVVVCQQWSTFELMFI